MRSGVVPLRARTDQWYGDALWAPPTDVILSAYVPALSDRRSPPSGVPAALTDVSRVEQPE